MLNPSAEVIAAGYNLKNKSGNTWRGACPVHGGSSFEVTEKRGKVLFHCWAGCGQKAILAVLRRDGYWPNGKQLPRGLKAKPDKQTLVYSRQVVLLACSDMDNGLPLSDSDAAVLRKAIPIVECWSDATPGSQLAIRALRDLRGEA